MNVWPFVYCSRMHSLEWEKRAQHIALYPVTRETFGEYRYHQSEPTADILAVRTYLQAVDDYMCLDIHDVQASRPISNRNMVFTVVASLYLM